MNLPLIANRLTGVSAGRPGLQVGLIAAAAIAGYLTLMPFQHKSAAVTVAEQPQWVGHIERPDLETPAPPSAPVTSASYVVREAVSDGSPTKKTSTNIAVTPKNIGKPVLPPRRPLPSEEATHVAPPVAVASAEPVSPGLIPPALIPLDGEAKPQSRGLLARVTDRLPARGSLLKPFNVVGDAFHNLVKSF